MLNIVKNKYSQGMSLVEVIVVMAILSVVMSAVMSLYIPAVQSTSVQTDLTDVQSNLRLAVNRMTQDLLMSGFLLSDDPITFESGTVNDPNDLTIQTRSLVGKFGRVDSATNPSPLAVLTLSSTEMLSFFPVGTFVRIFNPINMSEIDDYVESNATAAQAHVYEVTAVSAGTVTINHGGELSAIAPAGLSEAIMIPVRDNQQPPLQKIRYRVVDGNLQRTINDTIQQILARGVNSVQFAYAVSATSGRVNKVDITLQGETKQFKGETKIRQLRSSVTLRNVF
jgi:prepilin-type N-terminal cleavage/methylation domain-containing protein